MANRYADVQVVLKRCGVTAADAGLADDDALKILIGDLNDRASAAIEDYCRRDFIEHANQVEKYDGTDDAFLDLRGWPIISITSVTADGVALVAGTDYRQRPGRAGGEAPGILEKPAGQTWAKNWDRYVVTYSWGYASPPLDVKRIAEDVVVRGLQAIKHAREATGASSVSMDGFSTTYDSARLAGELLDEDRAVLAKWRFHKVG